LFSQRRQLIERPVVFDQSEQYEALDVARMQSATPGVPVRDTKQRIAFAGTQLDK
jgi:hypothetical protein